MKQQPQGRLVSKTDAARNYIGGVIVDVSLAGHLENEGDKFTKLRLADGHLKPKFKPNLIFVCGRYQQTRISLQISANDCGTSRLSAGKSKRFYLRKRASYFT